MRRATADDIPDLVEMGVRFHEEVSPVWPLSKVGLASTLSALIASVGGYVARTDGGFIAGLIQINPIADDWPVGCEFLWWADDGRGMELKNGFRKWAEERGAKEIRWSCPAGNDRVRKVYARRAVETETIYSECLKCA